MTERKIILLVSLLIALPQSLLCEEMTIPGNRESLIIDTPGDEVKLHGNRGDTVSVSSPKEIKSRYDINLTQKNISIKSKNSKSIPGGSTRTQLVVEGKVRFKDPVRVGGVRVESSAEPPQTLNLLVPRMKEIAINATSRFVGREIEADLHVELNENSEIDIDQMRNGSFILNGNINTHIVNAHADFMSFELNGTGTLNLTNSSIKHLSITHNGAGDILVNGTIGQLNFARDGSGDVEIGKVREVVENSDNGSGKLRIIK